MASEATADSVNSSTTTTVGFSSDTSDETTALLPRTAHNQKRDANTQSPVIESNVQDGYQTIASETGIIPDEQSGQQPNNLRAVFGVVSVMLIGVFISQMDSTLVMAAIGTISSDFNDLQNSSWLISSYLLAMCVAQPLYGKLSDIFGRKTMLQVAYLLFALGCVGCGLGQSIFQVVIGRVIQGLGGAGMVSLVSIILTDLVPLREVGLYRSYVNVFQTVGRSCGGPIGGALAQTIGWRWAFLFQAPLTAIAMILVAWKLKVQPKSNSGAESDQNGTSQSLGSKLKRIDFPGAIFMSTSVLAFMLILDMGGEKVSWTSPIIPTFAVIAIISGTLFYITEKRWAKEPVFPLRLLSHKEVVLDYVLLGVQIASQVALMVFIPLYFQVTKNANPAEAGSYLVPAVIGNMSGALFAGSYVNRTGRYKLPITVAGLSATLCFTLLLTTWNGNTPPWQALFVFFGGFATGITQNSTFVDLAATVDESEMAIASSGLYLSANIGSVFGVSVASAAFSTSLKWKLESLFSDWSDGDKIIEKALSNVEYVQGLTGKVHKLVLIAYVVAFRHAFAFSLCCAIGTLVFGLLVREKRLHR